MRAIAWLVFPACFLADDAGAQAPNRLLASGTRAALTCVAGDARVLGSGNDVTVAGACHSLEVAGSDNVVAIDLEPGSVVRLDGDNDRVVFTGDRPPEAITHGVLDLVVPQAAAPSATLVLDPSSPSFDVSCQDRDVVIRGDGQSYVLRGGCRSISVQGKLDRITAELLPGALVSVGGAGVLVNYVLVAPGPAPVVRVTARGLRANQIQHYGDSQLALATER